jgi:phosphopentomutase
VSTGKALLIILDGVGVGELPDAAEYGDEGSNTLANTARAVGGLYLPHLRACGLGNILPLDGVSPVESPQCHFGKMSERSRGKDSTTGHWELSGLVTDTAFPLFPHGFPPALMERFLEATGCGGFLGNTTASGTAIINELGEEHVRTGYPIVYTSADSVFQIAAHEGVIPVEDLYRICQVTRDVVCQGPFAVGRVIARPFIGSPGSFARTTNRKDFSLLPPASTVLDLLSSAGLETAGVGKIDDLFANRGLRTSVHTRTNAATAEAVVAQAALVRKGLVMANFGDFDTLYGHRNDPSGFAAALEEFDVVLPDILETLDAGDLFILTADHGNDPVTPSTDHSREFVPLLSSIQGGTTGNALGTRSSFTDVAVTVAHYFGIHVPFEGTSFLSLLQ